MAENLRLQIESDVNMKSLMDAQTLSDNPDAEFEKSLTPGWSPADQRALDALLARRDDCMTRRSDEVLEPFKEVFKGVDFTDFPYAGNAIRARAADIIKRLMPEVRVLRGCPTKAFVFPLNLKWDGLRGNLIQPKFPMTQLRSWDANGVRDALSGYSVDLNDVVAVDDNIAVVSVEKHPSLTHLVVVRLYD